LPIKQTNKDFERVAKQLFQNLYWFGFKRKALVLGWAAQSAAYPKININ